MDAVEAVISGDGKKLCPLTTRDLVDRIVLFIQKFGDIEFYSYQSLITRRIVESLIVCDGAIITALWARQCGKTTTIGAMVVGLAVILPALANVYTDDPRLQPFQRGFKAGIYAPIQWQSDKAFGEMRDRAISEKGQALLADPGINVAIVQNTSTVLKFSNGSRIMARTASPDAKIEGDTHHLVICEESQDLSRTKVEKSIRPMLTNTNGTMVKIGTAGESRGGFHVTIQQNEEDHRRGGPRNHFQIPYDVVIREKQAAYERTGNVEHTRYAMWVENQITKYGGKNTNEFKMNFECLWMESRVIAVNEAIFTSSSVRLVHLEAGPRKWGVQVAGLDIGKTDDSTVLTTIEIDYEGAVRNPHYLPDSDEDKQVYYPKTVVDWLELLGSFEGNTGQYRMLVDYLMETSIKVLVIDATALGDPVFERIDAMVGGQIVCVPFKFGPISKNLLYKYYLQELHAGRFRYAAGPLTQQRPEYQKFVQEHQDLDKFNSGGYVTCAAPEGGKDDYPDSAALAAWAEKISDEVIMPEIQVSSASSIGGGGGSRWSRGGSVSTSSGSGQGGALSYAPGASNRYARRR